LQVRKNRLLSLKAGKDSDYIDRRAITDEIAESRRLSAQNNWPIIDVSRRSIEETAAAIIALYQKHRKK
ncbi:MAG: kinase/pyrophosphorylase, partial [Fimbriimonadaceae bacterium]|nr:kinase/pyrophosphorylase [Alphaproteobacteria bacterium]